MTEQEKINNEVQMKLAMQDAKFNQFMQEMRDRDNQRAEDIREIRTSINALQNTFQNRLDDMGKHVRNLSLTAMAAIGAMVVTVIISLLRN